MAQIKHLVVGVDEAGRGPLAGPVVAGAVVLCADGIDGLVDSMSTRRLSPLSPEQASTRG